MMIADLSCTAIVNKSTHGEATPPYLHHLTTKSIRNIAM